MGLWIIQTKYEGENLAKAKMIDQKIRLIE